jgi:hypothetical protein
MTLVTLPSGAIAPLETPGLLPLLSGGGGTLALAQAALAHDEVGCEDLTDEDRYAVAMWGLRAFCETDDAIELAAVCEAYREPPSWRLGISEPTLAWALDEGCLSAFRAAIAQAHATQEEPEQPPDGVLTYSVPDTWTGD